MYTQKCVNCDITYQSEHQARVGYPCPNTNCPRGNPILDIVTSPPSWRNRIIKTAGIAGGISALGSILYFDVGGWGTFFSDLMVAILVQFIIALILFSVLLTVLRIAFKKVFESIIARRLLIIIFLGGIIFASPILALIFQRPLDDYDVLQTIILGVATNLLSKPIEYVFNKFWGSA